MQKQSVPLIDLNAQYRLIKDEIDSAILNVMSNSQFIMGDSVKEFEKEFGKYIGTKHAISVANGTDALIIALKALGIGYGDEVITTAFTFFASAESISSVGATPVFVDVELDTFNIDASMIEEKITSKTKAIMPVHIFGQPCDMDVITTIARKHNLFVIEDACQAVGAEYKGEKAGTFGDVACFSFFPTKNLGCAGDGGMIVTNNDKVATICKALRTHGSGENGKKAYNLLNKIEEVVETDNSLDQTVYNPLKYYNYLVGHNSRLDEIQAAILHVKLKYLDNWNTQRRKHAAFYNLHLKETNLILPFEHVNVKHVYHMYILQSEDRDELTAHLEKEGIATGIYYPVPLHFQKVYTHLGYKTGDLPNSEYLSKRTFAIPMFAELDEKILQYTINGIVKFGDRYEK